MQRLLQPVRKTFRLKFALIQYRSLYTKSEYEEFRLDTDWNKALHYYEDTKDSDGFFKSILQIDKRRQNLAAYKKAINHFAKNNDMITHLYYFYYKQLKSADTINVLMKITGKVYSVEATMDYKSIKIIMNIYYMNKDVEKLLEIVKLSHEKGLALNPDDYFELIDLLCKKSALPALTEFITWLDLNCLLISVNALKLIRDRTKLDCNIIQNYLLNRMFITVDYLHFLMQMNAHSLEGTELVLNHFQENLMIYPDSTALHLYAKCLLANNQLEKFKKVFEHDCVLLDCVLDLVYCFRHDSVILNFLLERFAERLEVKVLELFKKYLQPKDVQKDNVYLFDTLVKNQKIFDPCIDYFNAKSAKEKVACFENNDYFSNVDVYLSIMHIGLGHQKSELIYNAISRLISEHFMNAKIPDKLVNIIHSLEARKLFKKSHYANLVDHIVKYCKLSLGSYLKLDIKESEGVRIAAVNVRLARTWMKIKRDKFEFIYELLKKSNAKPDFGLIIQLIKTKKFHYFRNDVNFLLKVNYEAIKLLLNQTNEHVVYFVDELIKKAVRKFISEDTEHIKLNEYYYLVKHRPIPILHLAQFKALLAKDETFWASNILLQELIPKMKEMNRSHRIHLQRIVIPEFLIHCLRKKNKTLAIRICKVLYDCSYTNGLVDMDEQLFLSLCKLSNHHKHLYKIIRQNSHLNLKRYQTDIGMALYQVCKKYGDLAFFSTFVQGLKNIPLQLYPLCKWEYVPKTIRIFKYLIKQKRIYGIEDLLFHGVGYLQHLNSIELARLIPRVPGHLMISISYNIQIFKENSKIHEMVIKKLHENNYHEHLINYCSRNELNHNKLYHRSLLAMQRYESFVRILPWMEPEDIIEAYIHHEPLNLRILIDALCDEELAYQKIIQQRTSIKH